MCALPASLGQARSNRTTTIRILSVVQTYVPRDVAPKGVSPGDSVRMTDRLYNLVPQFGRPRGAPVGTDSGTERILPGNQAARFQGVARLPGGSIVVSGRIPLADATASAKVVGGTGRFAHAGGTVEVRTLPGNGRATNVFRLTLP